MADQVHRRFGPVTHGALLGGFAMGVVGVWAANTIMPVEWTRQTLAGAVTLGAMIRVFVGAIVERRRQVVDLFIDRRRENWRCPECLAGIEAIQSQPRRPVCDRDLARLS